MSVRSGRMYFGNNVDDMRGWSSVHGASRAKQYLLKPSGTALMLSEMAPGLSSPDDSWRSGSPSRNPCGSTSVIADSTMHGALYLSAHAVLIRAWPQQPQ